MGLHAGTLELFAATPSVLRSLTHGLPAEITEAPGGEGWSVRDVVAHLASIQNVANVERVRIMMASDNPLIPNADEEQILEASGLRGRPLSEVLELFERERSDAVAMLHGLSADDLRRTGQHSAAGEVCVADIVHHIAYHDLTHIQQIAALLAAPIEQRRGNMRMF